jgi:hypothetical protein
MYLFSREGPFLADLPATVHLSSSTSESRVGRMLELRRYVRDTRPDLVVSFLSYFTVLAAVKTAAVGARVMFVLGTPMSAFLSDADYHWKTSSHRTLFSLITRAGYSLADAIATTSKGVSDDLMQHFGVRESAIRVVHNPIDFAAMKTAVAEPLDDRTACMETHGIVSAGHGLSEELSAPSRNDGAARRRLPAAGSASSAGGRNALRPPDRVVACPTSSVGGLAESWKYRAGDVFALTCATRASAAC